MATTRCLRARSRLHLMAEMSDHQLSKLGSRAKAARLPPHQALRELLGDQDGLQRLMNLDGP